MPLFAILWASTSGSSWWVEVKAKENPWRSSVYKTMRLFRNDQKGTGLSMQQWPEAMVQLRAAKAQSSLLCWPVPSPFCGVSHTRKEEHTGKGWYLTIWEMELVLVIPLEPFLGSSEILLVNFSWNYFWEKLGFWQNSFLVSKKNFVKIALTYSRCSSSLPGPWRCLFWQALPLCRQWLCCISALLSVCSYPFIVSCGVCFHVIKTWHYVVIAT